MPSTIIDAAHRDISEVKGALIAAGDLTYATYVEDIYKKALVLAIGSYFEQKVTGLIEAFCSQATKEVTISAFLSNQALNRRYHSMFTWNSKKINSFFGLFGGDFLDRAKKRMNSDPSFKKACDDFMRLGKLRNEIAHEDFFAYPLDLTSDEVCSLYQSAFLVLEHLKCEFALQDFEY